VSSLHDVVLLAGDGIGPEVSTAARTVVDATGVKIAWREAAAGESAVKTDGVPLPVATRELIQSVGVVLKGPMSTPEGGGYPSPNGDLRIIAGTYVNVRIAKTLPHVATHYPGTHIAVIRDVTEDVYRGVQQYVGPDAAVGIKFITRATVERLARFAFRFALENERSPVTIVHKAGSLKCTDGLFLEAALNVAKEFPQVKSEDHLIDAAAMHLVRRPQEFGVIVAPHQYGDILGDLCAGLVGGLGIVGGASYGDRSAIFEAMHGSAPKYAGMDRANPTALIASAILMLNYLGEGDAARRLDAALLATIASGVATVDVGGQATTTEMTEAIVARLRSG
jgi:isocitrate dehydrogenase (NAD+)